MTYYVITRTMDTLTKGPKIRYLGPKDRYVAKLDKARKFGNREAAELAKVGLEQVIEIAEVKEVPCPAPAS